LCALQVEEARLSVISILKAKSRRS